ncbi:MAG: hypothetical protein J07HR59_00456 [Halorubrum sp. J07HR59]|nr:MAG: hypothetical protein J07HR59_00456 [Halorubrum sp. J07HR59]
MSVPVLVLALLFLRVIGIVTVMESMARRRDLDRPGKGHTLLTSDTDFQNRPQSPSVITSYRSAYYNYSYRFEGLMYRASKWADRP